MATALTALDELKAQVLQVSRQKTLPSDMTLGNDVVIRVPWLWLVLIEMRGWSTKAFLTEDKGQGKKVLAFSEAVTRVFSTSQKPPFFLPHAQKEDAAKLTQYFAAIGILYTQVPLPTEGNMKDAVTNVIAICSTIMGEAMSTVRDMNARHISALGGSGERYLAARLLDPSLYGDDDADALKKATTRAEAPLEVDASGRKRAREDNRPPQPDDKEKTCTRCKKTFTGSWSQHKKKGDCS